VLKNIQANIQKTIMSSTLTQHPTSDVLKKSKAHQRELRDVDRRIRKYKKIEKRIRPFQKHLDVCRKNLEAVLDTNALEEICSLRCPETPIIKLFQVIGIVFELTEVDVLSWEVLEDHNEQHWHQECVNFCSTDIIRKMLNYDYRKISDQSKELLKGLTQDPTMAVTNLSKVSMACGTLAEFLTGLYSYLIAIDSVESDEIEIENLSQVRSQIKELKKERQQILVPRDVSSEQL
jgi:flagellin-specific chaperone FliS